MGGDRFGGWVSAEQIVAHAEAEIELGPRRGVPGTLRGYLNKLMADVARES